MTDLEKAHLTELICLARGRGASDTEIAAALRAEADHLDQSAQAPSTEPTQQDSKHG